MHQLLRVVIGSYVLFQRDRERLTLSNTDKDMEQVIIFFLSCISVVSLASEKNNETLVVYCHFI